MFNKITMGMIALSLATTMVFAVQGVRFNVGQGDKEETFNMMMEEDLEKVGFILSDPHERINDAYLKKYGQEKNDGKVNPDYDQNYKKSLDNLGFFSITNDKKVRELMMKEPAIGGFSPFNLHIYKKSDEDKTYVGHVTPDTILDIVGIKDKTLRKAFNASFADLDAVVDEKIGGEVKYIEYTSLPEKPMMTFEYKFKRPKDMDDFIDEFQEAFEEKFEENGYIIAGYVNFVETYEDMEADFSGYDVYFVYSLCHFRFSYGIFNKGRPDTGVFAPCSMYMYIKEGSNKIIIGMPKLETWISVMGIKDTVKVKSIKTLDAEITKSMLELGAKEI